MPYACGKCGKIYKNNGKCIRKHQIEKCHAMILRPKELIEKQDIDLTTIMNRIEYIEFMIKRGNFKTRYQDDPIERIKAIEAEKIHDPLLTQYRQVFNECIKDLQEILKKGMVYLKKPQPYESEITEEMAIKKLEEINAKNKKRQLDASQLTLMRK